MPAEQSYKTHVRWFPLFHFVVIPLLLLNLIDHAVRIYTRTGDERIEQIFWTILSITLILMALAARLMALKAQDRVIRLEERIRHQQLLSDELLAKATGLDVGQIIALRFASDAELPGLVERTLNGEFAKTSDIKMAIKDWRADYHRV